MPRTIHLHNIEVKSLSHPHGDLPADMQMSAQLIFNRHIFLQTMAVEMEPSQNSWKLKPDCNIPEWALTFCLAIIRHSPTRGIRLLGHTEATQDEALRSGENDKISLCLNLAKINPDGPLLQLIITASVSDFAAATPCNGMDVLRSQINSVNSNIQTIEAHLNQMDTDSKMHIQSDTAALWAIYESILFLPTEKQVRARLLKQLGHICLKHSERSHMIDYLNQSVYAYDDAVRDDPGNVTHLQDLGFALYCRFQQRGGVDDINKAVVLYRDALNHSAGNYLHTVITTNLSTLLGVRFRRLHDINDLKESMSMQEDVLQLTPDGHPEKPGLLNNLSNSLLHCYEEFGDLGYLQECIIKQEDAVRLTPDGHPEKPFMLHNLGNNLRSRFEQLGDLSDINDCISKQEDAAFLAPDRHSDKPSWLNDLGCSLLHRFERLGDLNDINESISKQAYAIFLTPEGHPKKPGMLKDLGNALRLRFQRLGDLRDINDCISKLEDAVGLTPDGHPDKPSWLMDLGTSFICRFERLSDLSDINKGISILKDAVHLTPNSHLDKPTMLQNLGNALLRHFQQCSDLSDLNECISKQEDAVHLTPDGHPQKPARLNNLGTSLKIRFEQLGDLADLIESISKHEDAVHLTPDSHPLKPVMLSNLSNSLSTRFERLGDLSDLHESISKGEDAVHLIPDGHPDKPANLTNLGSYLRHRFDQFGALSDLNESISKQKDAVGLTPDGHRNKPIMLRNLGTALQLRFERLGGLGDLNECISKKEAAVRLTPGGHSEKPGQLSSLGISLLRRFQRLEDLSDINNCISMQEAALHLTPEGHINKPSRLSNLGYSLLLRFQKLGDLTDINESISKQKNAVHLTPDGDPARTAMLNHLGIALQLRSKRSGDLDDLQQSICQSTAAACSATGPAHVRLDSAKRWAHCAQEAQHSSLLTAFQVALDLLSEVAGLGLPISDRHYQIMKAGPLVRDAAAAAISSGQLEKAVEWLEQGRSIIWGQFLNLRTPVDELQQKWPELATELISLSAKLDRGTTQENDVQLADSGAQQSLRSIAHQEHENAHKRNVLLSKIRHLPGFHQFMLPKTFSQLSSAAQKGPVVLLNVSQMSCDGLIVQKGLTEEVMHVPLDDFTPEYVKSLAESFEDLMPYVGRGDIDRLHAHRERSFQDLGDKFAWILSELWVRLVKPVLNALAITTPTKDNLPRIWWCPTGPLTFLPIHAAGLYGKDVAFGSKLSDFMISSYTPSLATLMQGFCPTSLPQHEFQLLVVAQPSSVGLGYIPGTKDEIQRIQQCARGKVSVQSFVEHETTLANVEEGMMKSSWVHFACHGVQDQYTPTKSALLLAGSSRLTLERIIKLSLPHASFAFLSACQTATGDKELQDESVHLAAGMLLAGYQGVIATMWSIMDNDAPQVALDVYEHLFKKSPPDSTQAAEALHLAIRNLCESSGGKKSFFHWVPYIHVGV
ncbi:TPR-like protein [Mycena albidolilacea]|uniref:TPR-like protein n=1 Tax=Mycena albidolilacea TaxID=1033008 RepID=A0AAD6Z220_9AGAR|nr:TPR-like protein [Mycena albidolilacea]